MRCVSFYLAKLAGELPVQQPTLPQQVLSAKLFRKRYLRAAKQYQQAAKRMTYNLLGGHFISQLA